MNNVFEALADPTRRRILDRLRERGALSVTDVAAPLEMTRQGATKHLDVLARSGLIAVRREGRYRLHELNPVPLVEVQDWLAPYAAEWDHRLTRLKQHLDRVQDEKMATSDPTQRERR